MLLRLPLRTPYGLMLVCGAMFGGAASFFFWKARTLGGPLIVNGIELSQQAGVLFFAALGVLSLGFVVVATLAILRGLLGAPRVIEVTETELRIPQGRFQTTLTPLLRSTLAATLTTVHSNVFLLLQSGAAQASLQKSFFRSDDWQKLLDVVRKP